MPISITLGVMNTLGRQNKPATQMHRYVTWGGESLPESYFVVFMHESSASGCLEMTAIRLCVDDESDVVGEYVATGAGTWRCWAREDFEVGDPETIACRMFRDTDPNDASEFQEFINTQQSPTD